MADINEKAETISIEEFKQFCSLYQKMNKMFDGYKMKYIQEGFEDGATVEQMALLANPYFEADQMDAVLDGIKVGLSIDQLKSFAVPEMPAWKMARMREQHEASNRVEWCRTSSNEWLEKIRDGYDDPRFYEEQLHWIREGFEAGLTAEQIKLYADPYFNANQMFEIANGLSGCNLSMEQVSLYALYAHDVTFMNDMKEAFAYFGHSYDQALDHAHYLKEWRSHFNYAVHNSSELSDRARTALRKMCKSGNPSLDRYVIHYDKIFKGAPLSEDYWKKPLLEELKDAANSAYKKIHNEVIEFVQPYLQEYREFLTELEKKYAEPEKDNEKTIEAEEKSQEPTAKKSLKEQMKSASERTGAKTSSKQPQRTSGKSKDDGKDGH